jgi:16S rRNA (cytosine967-C5)-methyltransferase
MKTAAAPQRSSAATTLAAAARVVSQVVAGRSADAALAALEYHPERRAVRAVALGTVRWYLRFEPAVMPLLARPGSSTAPLLVALLVTAVHQLEMSRNPRESTVSAAVDAARELQLAHAAGLINAVLRRYLREREGILARIDSSPASRSAHPDWLVAALQRDWPDDVDDVLTANNAHPPLTLRVSTQRLAVADYLRELEAAGVAAHAVPWMPTAVVIDSPVAVARIPRFATGEVSVQDASAQLAAVLLDAQPGERVLDACAAPGGKTGALLERTAGLQLTALDRDPQRLRRVAENLSRLNRQATLVAADLMAPAGWWDGAAFDRILLDAPCSGSGVIRRHPDIKLLRRDTDIAPLAEQQFQLLCRCWTLLRPGGRLVYATCSLLRPENAAVIERFLAAEPTATENALSSLADLPWRRQVRGWQLLPGGPSGGDGFYYTCLTRNQ